MLSVGRDARGSRPAAQDDGRSRLAAAWRDGYLIRRKPCVTARELHDLAGVLRATLSFTPAILQRAATRRGAIRPPDARRLSFLSLPIWTGSTLSDGDNS